MHRIRPLNPLTRVPTLILDDGDVLVDSHLIIAHLEDVAPEGRFALARPPSPIATARRKVAGLATGLADKGVSLFYEQVLHDDRLAHLGPNAARRRSPAHWLCSTRTAPIHASEYWFGDRHRPCRHRRRLRHPPYKGSPA
jgi:glutathione S-transferase